MSTWTANSTLPVPFVLAVCGIAFECQHVPVLMPARAALRGAPSHAGSGSRALTSGDRHTRYTV
eukprot:538647-Rhodomonas_salina.2